MERNATFGRTLGEVITFLIAAVALGLAIVAIAIALNAPQPQPRDRRGRFIKRPENHL